MNSRIVQMEEFLKYHAKLYKQNPGLKIKKETIYNDLMNYELQNDEVGQSLAKYFDDWQYRFRGRKVNVFYSFQQPRFLQFHYNAYKKKDHVKIYLSFSKEDVFECVNMIFDYIDQNELSTLSKVADVRRSDEVVLRMSNVEDAKKLLEFINNNEYLSTRAKPVNPFLIKSGVAGLANDRLLSYNETLSFIIAEYFKKVEDYDKVSLLDFRRFVVNYHNNVFASGNEYENFSNSDIFLDYKDTYPKVSDRMANFYQVFHTIILALDSKTKLEDFFNHVSMCQDNTRFSKLSEYFSNMEEKLPSSAYTNNDKAKLFNEYLMHAKNKYGAANVIVYINSYLDGNENAITRDNNFRDLFVKNLTPNDILRITNNDVKGYINKLFNIKENNNDEIISLFVRAIYETQAKYGAAQACHAIRMISHNNLSYITNGNGNYRDKLSEYSYNELIAAVNNYIMSCPDIEGCDRIESALNNIIDSCRVNIPKQ